MVMEAIREQVDIQVVEARAQWLRGLTKANAVESIVQALREGESEDVLLAAGAVCACRYIKNEAHNLLGFVSHAMIACEDVRTLMEGQTQATRWYFLTQALYQVVFDLHDPCLGPYELLPSTPYREKSVEDNIRLLRTDVRMGEYLRADHRLVALEQDMPREQLIDLLLEIGMEGMVTDDHTLISPSLVLGMMELVGWQAAFEMLRVTLRYSASFPRHFEPYDRALKLMQEYGLEQGVAATGVQSERIEDLRQRFLSAAPQERPLIVAQALAEEGISPETILAAVTLTAADMYLMAEPVPHDDFDAISREVAPIHIGTSTNALRAMLPYYSPRTKVLAALSGGNLLERGPSVLNAAFEFVPFAPGPAYPAAYDVNLLADQTPDALLGRLPGALRRHDYREATAVVQAYAQRGAESQGLIAVLTDVAATDDGTLLHSAKHLGAMVREFRMSTHPARWNYLIAAARFIAWYADKNTAAYDRAVVAMG
jgi:hypothetical protein